jgi:valyl-tRNA synthetase
MLEKFPVFSAKINNLKQGGDIDTVIETIKAIRNLRSQYSVAPSKKISAKILPATDKNIFERGIVYIQKLANADIELTGGESGEKDDMVAVLPQCKIIISAKELIDKEKELARLEKELGTAKNELARAQGKLGSRGFISKAPQNLIDAEKQKVEKYSKLIEELNKSIEAIK